MTKPIFFLLALGVIAGCIALCASSKTPKNGEIRDQVICCDSQWYVDDPSIDGCCDGKVFRSNESICCNNRIVPVGETSSYRCCGDAAYDEEKQTCCDGKTILGPFTKAGCCGSQGFDWDVGLCCGDSLVDLKGEPLQNFKCCGGQTINEVSQFCCDDTIVDVPEGHQSVMFECCGKSLIEKAKNRCCKNVPYDINENLDCCYEDGTYVPLKDMCCNGAIHKDKSPGDGYTCCNKQAYNASTHECCYDSGTPLKRPEGVEPFQTLICCNGVELYQQSKQLCCDGKVLDKISPNSECCGSQIIELSKESCCNDKVIQVPDTRICCANEAWNIETHACCNDTLVAYDQLPKQECSKYCLRAPVARVLHFRG